MQYYTISAVLFHAISIAEIKYEFKDVSLDNSFNMNSPFR